MPQKRVSLPLFRTVVFATDLSARSREAFRVACSVTREEATRLIILNVEEPVSIMEVVGFGEVGVPVFAPVDEPAQREALLRQMREEFVPGTPIAVEYQVTSGNAAEEILRTSEEAGCDLIVLGTQGRTGLDRLLLGSVAEAVMRRSRCACLTVGSRPSAEHAPAPIRTILHPTDFSPHSAAALRVARCLARDQGARLVLVHVVPSERLAGVVSEGLMDLELGREALAWVQREVDAADLKYPVENRLRRGDPVAEILDTAGDTGCDLIVMGSHGRSGLGRLVLGSVAEAVLRKAPCPVLTIKEHIRAPLGAAREAVPMST